MSEVTLLYTHDEGIGYGRMGVMVAQALADLGVGVYDDLGPPPQDIRGDDSRRVGRAHKAEHTNVVSWLSVPTHAAWWWEGQYASAFTMWEASVLPPSFRDTLHEFQVVIVPSEQNVELFSKYHDNVVHNPLGVDPQRWHYVPRLDRDQQFRFLIGGSGKRKGTDLAFKAFRTVFGDWKGKGPEPVLVMKNPKGESQYRGWDRVVMASGRLTNEAEVDLYRSAHCYVQPSRGEGFGLQPLQAMAQGIPTILTDAHGHSSFAKYATHPIGWDWKKADYFIYGDAGDWWEPDFEQLCEAMWDAYHDYEPHRAAAEQVAKNVIPNQFLWEHTARRFIDAHDGHLDLPYRGDGTYHRPTQQRFKVNVSQKWDAEIAGTRYFWFPGKDYYEVADVKRILFERGVLDPACLEGDDHGLAPFQVERIEEYSASKEHCPMCGQELNTKPTLSDKLYEEMLAEAAA